MKSQVSQERKTAHVILEDWDRDKQVAPTGDTVKLDYEEYPYSAL